MPKLVIDNQTVEVAPGTSVLEAARAVGVVIPHFCYHPALGAVGACRLCAMTFLEGPVKGIQMSCMIPAQDGMVVSTGDEGAVRLRQQVIQWLMLNHPHDCPVCDEGGECLLQDYTIAGGHGRRSYDGPKRTHLNQDLGPHVEHEMNRCIACYRCVRFYQEYAGGTDLGVLGSAGRVWFGRFREGDLASPFSGNLVDICPTGVFTDRTARFRARYWDYQMAPSVCPHCSLGCSTTPAARYRELLKVMARRNDGVNGWFICDRGRFADHGVNAPDRLRTPLVDGRAVSREEALEALVERLQEVIGLYGERSIALVGSSRLSLEGGLLLLELARVLEPGFLCWFAGTEERSRTLAAAALVAAGRGASMADVRQADCIVILESDLRDEGPMMLLAVRQAWRSGAPVLLVGEHAPLEQAVAVGIEAIQLRIIEEAPLAIFERPVIICGTRHNRAAEIEALARADARIAPLLAGPNAAGVARLAGERPELALEEALATGRVKGILALEADLPEGVYDTVPFVALADWRPAAGVARAGVLLPTTAWVEMDGTWVNNEGRAQRYRRVMAPGRPIRGLDPALHPPREHGTLPPGGDAEPAWQTVAALLEQLGEPHVATPYAGGWSWLADLDPEGEGVRLP